MNLNLFKNKLFFLFFSFLVITGTVIYTYWNLPKTFFQQDEWLILGGFLNSQGNGGYLKFLYDTMVYSGGIHVVPLTVIRSYLQIKAFHLNFSYYAWLSILNHIINTFLVFYLAFILLRKRLLAFLVGLTYAVSSISSQSVTWIAATISTQNSDSFLLLALILLSKYFKEEKYKKLLVASSISIFLGLFFKETLVIALFIFPAFYLVFAKNKNKKSFYKFLSPILIVMFIYFAIRFSATFVAPTGVESSLSKPWETPTLATYAYRALTFPLKIIPQSIFPADFLIKSASKLVYLGYPQYFASSSSETNPYVTQTVLFDLVSYTGGIFIIFICFYFYRRFIKEQPYLSRTLLFSLILIAISAFPFLFFPGRVGYFYIFEPRHLSVAVIGASFILTIIAYGIAGRIFKKEKQIYTLSLLIILPLLFIYAKNIRNEISTVLQMSQVRENILSKIYGNYPKLPKKAIIFAKSDSSYYGLPADEKILPFQSGLGQTLMVWYGFHNNLPYCLFKGDFLYEIHSQGYRECDGYGFGYFRKIEDLKKAVKENGVAPSEVIGFSFDSHTQLLTDITFSVRKDLTH